MDSPANALIHGDFTAATDPFALLSQWLAEARTSEINDPEAMALATVDADGLPDVRMVLMKEVDQRGLVFYTNTQSAKGQELMANPKAAILFHWKSLRRQIRVRGPVSVVPEARSDAYFFSRPRVSRLGAWASAQSRPLAARSVLEAAVQDVDARYPGNDIPRPPHWKGYLIEPVAFEFWQDGKFRLHDRILFTRSSPVEDWSTQRLYP